MPAFSVWIDYLNATDPVLVGLLTNGQVLAHPFVIAEIASGSLKNRKAVLGALRLQPGTTLWTRDKRLAKAADDLGLTRNVLH